MPIKSPSLLGHLGDRELAIESTSFSKHKSIATDRDMFPHHDSDTSLRDFKE
jgi:hypothetical protein